MSVGDDLGELLIAFQLALSHLGFGGTITQRNGKSDARGVVDEVAIDGGAECGFEVCFQSVGLNGGGEIELGKEIIFGDSDADIGLFEFEAIFLKLRALLQAGLDRFGGIKCDGLGDGFVGGVDQRVVKDGDFGIVEEAFEIVGGLAQGHAVIDEFGAALFDGGDGLIDGNLVGIDKDAVMHAPVGVFGGGEELLLNGDGRAGKHEVLVGLFDVRDAGDDLAAKGFLADAVVALADGDVGFVDGGAEAAEEGLGEGGVEVKAIGGTAGKAGAGGVGEIAICKAA